MMPRIQSTACIFAALCTFAPAALAQERAAPSVVVAYDDLDLSEPAGVDTLLRRLNTASKRVCGKRPISVRFGELEPYLKCRTQAVARAVETLDEPSVTLAFRAWIGESPFERAMASR